MYSFRLPKFENQNAGGNGLSSSIPRLVRLIRQRSATIKSPMHISYPRINLLASVAVFVTGHDSATRVFPRVSF